MIKPIKILLTTAGVSTDTFSLFSDADNYVTPFATGITKAQLLAGYISSVAPDLTSVVRVKSNTACMNFIDFNIPYILLEFTNINTSATTLGITDINNVSQWNTRLDIWFGDVSGINFTQVVINGNIAKFYGNTDAITVFPFYNLGIVNIGNTSSLNSLYYMALYGNNISIFNSEVFNYSTVTTLDLSFNKITNTNEILAYFVSINKTGFTLWLSMGTNVAPTGQGIIDKQTLMTNGNTIITN